MTKNKLTLKKKSSCQRMSTKMFGQCLKMQKNQSIHQNQFCEKFNHDEDNLRNFKRLTHDEKYMKKENLQNNEGYQFLKNKDNFASQSQKKGLNDHNYILENEKNSAIKIKKSKSQVQNQQAQKVKEKPESLNRKKSYILNSGHKSNKKLNLKSFSKQKQNISTNFSFSLNKNKSTNHQILQKTCKKNLIKSINEQQTSAYLSLTKNNKNKLGLKQLKKTLKIKSNKKYFNEKSQKLLLQKTKMKNDIDSIQPKISGLKSLPTQYNKSLQSFNNSIDNRLKNARKLSQSHSKNLKKNQNKLFLKIKTEYEGIVKDLSKIIKKEMIQKLTQQKQLKNNDENICDKNYPSLISSTHTIPISKQKGYLKTQQAEDIKEQKIQERQTVKWNQFNQHYNKIKKAIQQTSQTVTNLNIKKQLQQSFCSSSELSSVYLHCQNQADNLQRKLFCEKSPNEKIVNKNMKNLQLTGLKNKFKIKEYHQEFLEQKQNFSQSWKRQLSKQRYNKI